MIIGVLASPSRTASIRGDIPTLNPSHPKRQASKGRVGGSALPRNAKQKTMGRLAAAAGVVQGLGFGVKGLGFRV